MEFKYGSKQMVSIGSCDLIYIILYLFFLDLSSGKDVGYVGGGGR